MSNNVPIDLAIDRQSLLSLSLKELGGADRDRTDDLKLAKLALSQLSYGPDLRCQNSDDKSQHETCWLLTSDFPRRDAQTADQRSGLG